jgi:hypothetical protein
MLLIWPIWGEPPKKGGRKGGANSPTATRASISSGPRVTLPAVMKLLGHKNPAMTMRYLDVALLDLQREFHLARSQPRHLVPASRLPTPELVVDPV